MQGQVDTELRGPEEISSMMGGTPVEVLRGKADSKTTKELED